MEAQSLFDFSVNNKFDYIWQGKKPQGFRGIMLPEMDIASITGAFGEMVFQSRIRKLYSIWVSQYRIRRRVLTHARLDRRFIELSLTLDTGTKYHLQPFGSITQKGWQFNLMHYTQMDSRVQFETSMRVITIDVHLETAFLEILSEDFPELTGPLLEAVYAGQPFAYFKEPLFATPEMADTIHRLQVQLRRSAPCESLLDYLVTLLLIQAMQVGRSGAYLPMRYDDALQVRRLVELGIGTALSDLSQFEGYDYYARICAMSATTLKKYMRLLKGRTLRDLWQDARMEASLEKILNTNESLKEIANEVAFGHLPGFRKAFKKKFGILPGRLRDLGEL